MDNFSNSTGSSDSSSSDTPMSAAALTVLLQEGLDALKQHNYERAIAQLGTVSRSGTDRALQVKAKMGLVKAYASEGNLQLAIALCKSLSQERNSRVQQWASQTLQSLERYEPVFTDLPSEAAIADAAISDAAPSEAALPDAAIFGAALPNAETSESKTSDAVIQESAIADAKSEAADATGFVPFTSAVEGAETAFTPADDGTGFMPLDPASQTEQSASENPFALPPNSAITEARTQLNPVTKIQSTTKARSVPQPKTALQGNTKIQPAKPTKAKPTAPSSTPSAATAPPPIGDTPETPVKEKFHVWRQADRAQKWTSLGKVDITTLWAVMGLTAIALTWICWFLTQILIATVNLFNQRFSWLPLIEPNQYYGNPLWLIVLVLAALFGLSPWLLDRILQNNYGAKSLKLDMLSRYSPETSRLLKRFAGQTGYYLPTLSILYTTAPVIFSYGNTRRTARIAVSQGLLDQLEDDEIAAIYAAELGHIKHWDFGVVSGVTLVAQIFYWVYWQVAAWGDRQQDRALQSVAVGVSSLGYGAYWCVRWSGLWLSRLRLYYSDRRSCEMTGNPNGLTRALLKISIGIAKDIQRQGQTGALLDSFDLLLPVSYKSAITLGSACQQSPIEPLLEWDYKNPYRRWFSLNNSHPPLGDRLLRLATYAQRWRLESELELTQPSRTLIKEFYRQKDFLIQIAPFISIFIGLAIAYGLWLVGAIADRVSLLSIDWMWKDSSLLRGCILIAFSMGMFLRINPFFPDITRANAQSDLDLPDLLNDPTFLPIDSQPVRIQGKLLGNRGFANILAQDLMLKTTTGLIKLHFTSPLGVFGSIIPQTPRPRDFINSTVWVTGWLRRGVTLWIDVDKIQIERGTPAKSSHPLWATFLATMSALWGLYIITKGGF